MSCTFYYFFSDDTPPSSDNAVNDSDASINSDASDDGELDDSLPVTYVHVVYYESQLVTYAL